MGQPIGREAAPRVHNQVTVVADSERRIKMSVEFWDNYNYQKEISLISWWFFLAQSPEIIDIAYHEPNNGTNIHTDEALLYALLALPQSDSKKGRSEKGDSSELLRGPT